MAELAGDFPESLLAEWVDQNFRRDAADYPELITLRHLLSHSAGLDTHSIGAWDPSDVPTMREIILGSNDFDGYFRGGVEPIHAPRSVYDYSGGGFIVAEHVLELQVPDPFKDYLDAHVLTPARMNGSTFEKATSGMTHLARGCSRSSCSFDLLQTNVKAAGGLLANAREYAELLTAFINGGYTDGGGRVLVQSDIDEILTPAWHDFSTLAACSTPGASRNRYLTIAGIRTLVGIERCVGGKWRIPLSDGGGWYGLGVGLSSTVLADGYPRTMSHGGAQSGSRTYFELDRQSGDGFVVMVNGVAEWVDGDGYSFGAEPLLGEIHTAYHATY
jgi:CubicO group peptidase (beta-lactamase class C family)